MKIGILTYYGVHNYGAILQAYGLQQVIKSMGNEVQFLTFNRNYDHMPVGADKKYNLGIKSIPFLIEYLIDHGLGTFIYNFDKKIKLDAFRSDNMKIAKRYSDADVEMVVIGSDEVFSIDVGLNPFFYGHDIPCDFVISYAATFGSTTLEDIKKRGCEKLIASGITNMKNVSVRDNNSLEIVNELTGKKAKLVCDPVILYGYKNEIKKHQVVFKEKYLLLYSYDKNCNTKEDIELIRKFAKERGCKIYSAGYYHKWCDKNLSGSPEEELGYFIDAEYVLTDTFHGSVISLITNTEFAVVLKNHNQKVEFIMEQHGVSDRVVFDWQSGFKVFERKINYDKVNKIIDMEREYSLSYLRESLKND